ncbi:MAG: hypothetical protein WDO12_09230 [Pseudomonadota bacterium]
MMRAAGTACMAGLLWLAAGNAGAATLAADTRTLGATADLSALLPAAQTFTVVTAAQVKVTLADNATPRAFAQLKLIVSRGGAKVASLGAIGSETFAATPGDYKVQVVGVPAAASGSAVPSGSFDVVVNELTGNTQLAHFAAGVSAASSVPASRIVFAQPGSYQVTLTDRAFPAALADLSLLLNPDSGSNDMAVISSGPCTTACTATFNVGVAGGYDLFLPVTAANPDQAGLYSLKITGGPGNAVVYATTQPVGRLAAATAIVLPAAGSYALSSADFATPVALTSLKLRLVQGADLLASLDAAGSVAVNAPAAGNAQLFAFARAGTGNLGFYGLGLSQGATSVYGDVRTLPAGFDTTLNAGGYPYAFTVPAAANYRLQLHDLGFPVALGQLRAVVVQNGSVVQAVSGTSVDTSFQLAGGPAFLALIGSESAANADSLIGVSLAPQAGGNALLDQAQAFGASFDARPVTVATAGSYDLTVTDLAFPVAFNNDLAVAVTRGSQLVGQVFGGGRLRFGAQAGAHVINVRARPDATAQYGTWGFEFANTPPAPTIELAANPAAVSNNTTTTITWSASGATSCTASGAWTGGRAVSGTEVTSALTSPATYTLSCTGDGGSTSRSIDVTIKSASKGGGGALDLSALLLLAGVLYARRRRLRA